MKIKTCYQRGWDDGIDEIWDNPEHLLLKIVKAYLTTERGNEVDESWDISKPGTPVSGVGFRAWVAEPGKEHGNMWEFHLKDEIYGRTCGASASSYRPPGSNRRRKPGEWYKTPWVPQKAAQAVLKLFVKV